MTDVTGTASFTYADDGGAGADSIQANVGSVLSNTLAGVMDIARAARSHHN